MIDTSTGTIYLVAKSKVNASLVQYLHAIDVVTKAEKFGGPVLIQATVPGTASDGNGTTVSFSHHFENQRAGLLLENGHVVIGWSSHCDINPGHGWIMSYSATTLAQEGAFNTSADGSANGVWIHAAVPVGRRGPPLQQSPLESPAQCSHHSRTFGDDTRQWGGLWVAFKHQ